MQRGSFCATVNPRSITFLKHSNVRANRRCQAPVKDKSSCSHCFLPALVCTVVQYGVIVSVNIQMIIIPGVENSCCITTVHHIVPVATVLSKNISAFTSLEDQNCRFFVSAKLQDGRRND